MPPQKGSSDEPPSQSETSDLLPLIPLPLSDHTQVTDMNLSFAGCGFLGLYHLSVAQTLSRHGFLAHVQKYCGASAGALVASALALRGGDEHVLKECVDFCYSLAEDIRRKPLKALTPGVSLLRPLHTFLDGLLPEDAHTLATGRLYVSVTRKRKNLLVSEFSSREELLQYLLASSYIPFVTGSEAIFINRKRYTDGGMTDNLPILDEGRTLTVSPFSGKQDICPVDPRGRDLHMKINKQKFKVNGRNITRGFHAFFPPKQRKLDLYYEQGIKDAEDFLKREGHFKGEGQIQGEGHDLSSDLESGAIVKCNSVSPVEEAGMVLSK